MKKLLITLLLISPFSFADWGDVYYCQMTTLSETTLEGKRTDYILEKFQFKLDKTKNAMVFGEAGYFAGVELELREGAWPPQEEWHAAVGYAMARFERGNFLYAVTGLSAINSLSANCDKF